MHTRGSVTHPQLFHSLKNKRFCNVFHVPKSRNLDMSRQCSHNLTREVNQRQVVRKVYVCLLNVRDYKSNPDLFGLTPDFCWEFRTLNFALRKFRRCGPEVRHGVWFFVVPVFFFFFSWVTAFLRRCTDQRLRTASTTLTWTLALYFTTTNLQMTLAFAWIFITSTGAILLDHCNAV